MRCCLRPCTSARANILGILSIKQSSIPPTAQDAMRHGGASLRSRRRPHGATRRATLLPTRAALHSATRRATVFSICRYLRHRSAVPQRFHHCSISTTAVFPAPGISNIAVCQTSQYLGHRGIANIAVFPRFRIGIFGGSPGPWRPWRLDRFSDTSVHENPSQTWPGAAPGGGGSFFL